ncbi:MAG: hypothetical protein H0T43_12530, partial [Solirubrobacterales bacterium]|nr:hypothetical protein [Solirubrobacterales bacterium]
MATAVAATMLALASVAYACTVVATVDLDKAAATPGAQVNGTGKGFSQSPLSSSVDVHFNSLDGNVVWSGRAASTGQVAFSFKVPEGMAPGQYTIVATQRDAQGRAESGTPARST